MQPARVRFACSSAALAVVAMVTGPVADVPPARGEAAAPLVTATWVYGDVASCAAMLADDCAACLGGGTCEPIWPGVSGMDACTMLEAQPAPSHALVCVNLAVSLGAVGTCLQTDAPACPFDASAILEPADLRANVRFVDDAGCGAALDGCLQRLYGVPDDDAGGCCHAAGAPRPGWHWLLALAGAVALRRRRRPVR